MTEETKETVTNPDVPQVDRPKKYRCPACFYTGEGLVVKVEPPRKGMANPSGVYCPYCSALDRWRTVPVMEEVK